MSYGPVWSIQVFLWPLFVTVFGIKYSYKHDRKKDVEMYKINFLRILESNFLEEKTLIRWFFNSKSQKILIR